MIKFSKQNPVQYAGDMIVYCVRQNEKKAPICVDDIIQKTINRVFEAGDFVGREGQVLLYYPDVDSKKNVKRILVVGLGQDELVAETFRKAGGTIAGTAIKTKAQKIMVVVPEILDFDVVVMAEALTEGLRLGAYRFLDYKTIDDPDEQPGKLVEILLTASKYAAVKKGLQGGEVTAGAGCWARDMANSPANYWTPAHFAQHGRKLAKKYDFVCKVLAKNDMKRLGMGGILGVSQGSAAPPKMVILEYSAGNRKKTKIPTLLLVGKGLTFDAGGISLKPSAGMHEMKYDMCGGAAVLAVMQAVGELRPKNLNVTAIIPATENMPGPAALKPGDVIIHYGGKTVEIIDTDAEGRLILADGLAYGIKQYTPDYIVDIATLTGAVVVGLGHHRTGLLTNNDDLSQQLLAAGDKSGEPVWRLPLGPEYTKQLKSQVADLKNLGKRNGGAITAAAFLQEFVGDTPWAHLDIAGTAWDFTEKSYIPKGPSGVGVRLLLELIRSWK